MSLATLPMLAQGKHATIAQLVPLNTNDRMIQHLQRMGFEVGEPIEIIAKTFFKKGPIVVKIGNARFALRHSEALRIQVTITT